MKITAIVPTFNEERYIGRCLTDLLCQSGVDDFEVIVVDGASHDGTPGIVRSFPEFGDRLKLVENPRRLQVYAWNLGWKAARGEYVAFIVAHSAYADDYLAKCLETIERTGADAVGPVQTPEGSGPLGSAIAWCMSSPFGIGNARYRFAAHEEEADSVYSMFLRRETLERLGGYDERMAFDEDGDFNYRLRAAGGRIVVSPKIRARYFVRESLRALRRQMFAYGYWRRFTTILHPDRTPIRVYAPPALLGALALSAMLALTPLRALAAVVPAIYAAFVAAGVFRAAGRLHPLATACVAVVLPVMHLAYGAGFWRGLLTPPRRVLGGTARHSYAR